MQVVNGGKDKRAEQLATEADVYVTSYQSFRQDEKITCQNSLSSVDFR